MHNKADEVVKMRTSDAVTCLYLRSITSAILEEHPCVWCRTIFDDACQRRPLAMTHMPLATGSTRPRRAMPRLHLQEVRGEVPPFAGGTATLLV